MTEQQVRVPASKLKAFCIEALMRTGMPRDAAETTAEVLVTTDLWGVFTHGTKALRGYLRRLQAGGLKADAVPNIVREGPAWAIVDGHSAIGMVTSVFAMNTAIQKAKTAGVAYVGVRNSCHFGAAGYYTNLAAKADMIGMAMSNDIPSMAVPGSRKAVMGTNPFSYAVPAGREAPIFLDIASSAVAGGKIRIFQTQNKKVPDNWLVDAEGVPTNDPFVYPFDGSLLPFAGHKGYGIAMMIETFAGILSGGATRWDILSWIDHDPSLPTHHGAAFLAVDIGQIMPIQTFRDRADAMIRDIRESPKAKGSNRIYLPGEMEWEKFHDAIKNGILLPGDVIESLRESAEMSRLSESDFPGRAGQTKGKSA
jgi:ureidoglycolate dehydrogenase (NAD+)